MEHIKLKSVAYAYKQYVKHSYREIMLYEKKFISFSQRHMREVMYYLNDQLQCGYMFSWENPSSIFDSRMVKQNLT